MSVITLAIVLSLPIGIALGMLGGGGSVLTVPMLVYALDVERKPAIATSLLVVAATSAAAAINHARAGQVRWHAAAGFAPAAMLGAFAGGQTARFISGQVLLALFGLLMIVTSSAMWRGRRSAQSEQPRASAAAWKIMAQGLVVGFMTGLVGAGGGFLIVPALVLLGGLPMRAAVGTSLVIITAQSVSAFAGYVTHVRIDYPLASVVMASAVGGAFVGVALSRRVTPERLRRGFALLVAAVGVYMLSRETVLAL